MHAYAKLLLNDQRTNVGDTLPRSFPPLLADFILLFEPISPRFVSFLVGRKLKEWKNKGLIDGYKTKTKRIGKLHYKIYLDLDLTPEQTSRILRESLIQVLKKIWR